MVISFIGWLGETLYFIAAFDIITDRGFLSLPLCTIYGCSILAIYLIIGTPAKGRLSPLFKKVKILPVLLKPFAYIGLYSIYFVLAALIPTIAEFITALFFDKVFGVTLWCYSSYTHNLFGYICLEMSIVWGILITIAMGIIWPLLDKLVSMIPPKATKVIAVVLLVSLATDFILNFSYLHMNGTHLILY